MSSRRRLIIHLGMHKTGSTSIQDALYNNACRGANGEYVYFNFGSINHNHRIYSLFSDNPNLYYLNIGMSDEEIHNLNTCTKTLIEKEIEQNINKSFILSGEDLINLSCDELKKLNGYFSSFFDTIKILVYVRHPVSYMTSLLQQVIKSGVGFERFVSESPLSVDSALNLSMLYPGYRSIFERLRSVFGADNVILKEFPKSSTGSSDVVVDFFNWLNIPCPSNISIKRNESVSKDALAVVYILRKADMKNLLKLSRNEKRELISEVLKIEGRKLTLASNALLPILENNESDINWLKGNLSLDYSETDFLKRAQGQVGTERELASVGREGFRKVEKLVRNLSLAQNKAQEAIDIVWEVGVLGNMGLINLRSASEVFSNIRRRIGARHQSADILREIALSFEQTGDVRTALALMERAHELRPRGPVLNQKIQHYKTILSKRGKTPGG